jgi:hypothetical protein
VTGSVCNIWILFICLIKWSFQVDNLGEFTACSCIASDRMDKEFCWGRFCRVDLQACTAADQIQPLSYSPHPTVLLEAMLPVQHELLQVSW